MAIFIPAAAAKRIEREEQAKQAALNANKFKAVDNPHSLEIENYEDRREAFRHIYELLRMFHGHGGISGITLPGCDKDRLRVRAIERLMHDLLGDEFEREVLT